MKVVNCQKQPDVLLRVATFNTWHGLNGVGLVRFGEMESRSERLVRLAKQIDTLKQLEADIVCLQEVNPLPFRAYWYAKQLNKKVYFATANAGLKFGFGIPSNLNEGLAILCPRNWESHYVGTKHLNAKFNFAPLRLSLVANAFLSLQASENRIAFAVRVVMPASRRMTEFQGSQSVLVVCTHLYHGAGLNAAALNVLEKAKLSGQMTDTEYTALMKTLQKSDEVRELQINELLSWISSQQRPGEPVLMMGDFNTEPSSNAIQLVRGEGWTDAWNVAKENAEGDTWDPVQNRFASRTQKSIQVNAQAKGQAKVVEELDLIPKRIDYIFSKPWDENRSEIVGCFGKQLSTVRFGVGDESDHFGVACDFGATST